MSEPVVESSSPVPMLRREAILPRERRGGLGAVALLCSLAGVASGFALATTILATQIAQSEARMARRSHHHGPMHLQPFLGVRYLPAGDGSAKITDVLPDTPAAAIGLAPGDHIIRFDDRRLDQLGELGMAIRSASIGYQPTLTVVHGDTISEKHPILVGRMFSDDEL